MLKIKLTRLGKRNQPHYRIVVNERQTKRDGQYVEQVGHYNPISKDLVIDTKLYEKWIKQGAQPTDTVANLYKKFTAKKK